MHKLCFISFGRSRHWRGNLVWSNAKFISTRARSGETCRVTSLKEQGHDTQFMRRARSTDLFEEAAKGISGKRDRGWIETPRDERGCDEERGRKAFALLIIKINFALNVHLNVHLLWTRWDVQRNMVAIIISCSEKRDRDIERRRGERERHNNERRKERGKIEKEPIGEFTMINCKVCETILVCRVTLTMNDIHITYSFLFRFKDNGVSRHRMWKI